MRVHWYQNGTTFNSNYCTPYTSWLPSDYDPLSHTNNDWAIVKLNKPAGSSVHLGSMVGYFGYSSPSDESLSEMSISVTGYPTDHTFFMYWAAGHVYDMNANDENIKQYTFRHDADTFGGQSGAPVYNSSNVVVGIHVRGNTDGEYNVATRITTAISGLIAAADNMPFT